MEEAGFIITARDEASKTLGKVKGAFKEAGSASQRFAKRLKETADRSRLFTSIASRAQSVVQNFALALGQAVGSGLYTAIGEINQRLVDFGKRLRDAGQSYFQNFTKRLTNLAAFTIVAQGVTSLAATIRQTFSQIIAAAGEVAQSITGIADASERLGTDLKFFSGIREESIALGAQADDLESALGDLQQRALNSKDDFKDYGIEIRNAGGQIKSAEELFRAVAARIQETTDRTEQLALADQLMSDAGRRLLPILDGKAGSLDALVGSADKAGKTIDGFTAFVGRDLTMALNDGKQALFQVKTALLEAFGQEAAEGIRAVTSLLRDWAQSIRSNTGPIREFFLRFVEGVAWVIKSIPEMIQALGFATIAFGTLMTVIAGATGNILLFAQGLAVITAGGVITRLGSEADKVSGRIEEMADAMVTATKKAQGMSNEIDLLDSRIARLARNVEANMPRVLAQIGVSFDAAGKAVGIFADIAEQELSNAVSAGKFDDLISDTKLLSRTFQEAPPHIQGVARMIEKFQTLQETGALSQRVVNQLLMEGRQLEAEVASRVLEKTKAIRIDTDAIEDRKKRMQDAARAQFQSAEAVRTFNDRLRELRESMTSMPTEPVTVQTRFETSEEGLDAASIQREALQQSVNQFRFAEEEKKQAAATALQEIDRLQQEFANNQSRRVWAIRNLEEDALAAAILAADKEDARIEQSLQLQEKVIATYRRVVSERMSAEQRFTQALEAEEQTRQAIRDRTFEIEKERARETMSLAQQMGTSIANLFGQLVKGEISAGEAAIKVLQQVIQAVAQAAITTVTAKAAEAGASAASSQAGIPIVGPALAVGAIALVSGAVLALLSMIPTAHTGFDPTMDGMSVGRVMSPMQGRSSGSEGLLRVRGNETIRTVSQEEDVQNRLRNAGTSQVVNNYNVSTAVPPTGATVRQYQRDTQAVATGKVVARVSRSNLGRRS